MGTALELNRDVNAAMKNRSSGKQINVRLTEDEEKKLTYVIDQLFYQNVTDAVRDMLRNVYLESQAVTGEQMKEIVGRLPFDFATKTTQINMRLNTREAQMSEVLKDKFAGESISDVIRILIGLYYNTAKTKKLQNRIVA
jgi:hypothetical protein